MTKGKGPRAAFFIHTLQKNAALHVNEKRYMQPTHLTLLEICFFQQNNVAEVLQQNQARLTLLQNYSAIVT